MLLFFFICWLTSWYFHSDCLYYNLVFLVKISRRSRVSQMERVAFEPNRTLLYKCVHQQPIAVTSRCSLLWPHTLSYQPYELLCHSARSQRKWHLEMIISLPWSPEESNVAVLLPEKLLRSQSPTNQLGACWLFRFLFFSPSLGFFRWLRRMWKAAILR